MGARVFVFATIGLLLPGLAGAEIYRWVDDQGQVHFSDVAPAGADVKEVPGAAVQERIQVAQPQPAPEPQAAPAPLELVAAGPPTAWIWRGEMDGEPYSLRVPAGWGAIPADMLRDFRESSNAPLDYQAGFRRWDTPELVAPFIVVAPEPGAKLSVNELAAIRRGSSSRNHADLERELGKRASERGAVEEFALGETHFDEGTNTFRMHMQADGMEVLAAVTVTERGKLNLVGFYEPGDLPADGPAFPALVASLELSPVLVYQREAGALDAQDEKVGKAVGFIAAAVFVVLWLVAAVFAGTARSALRAVAWVASLAALVWLLRHHDTRIIAEASGGFFMALLGFAVVRALWQRMRGGPSAPEPLPGGAAGR